MKLKRQVFSYPYIVWMALFIAVPMVFIFYYAFNVDGSFSFSKAWATLSDISKWRVLWVSIEIAAGTTIFCLLLGYPMAYYIAHRSQTAQKFLYMLVMLPMCMSFLLRTLAWVGMLEDTGILNTILQRLGIGPLPLIRTNGAVILGMVYNYLPYMILPLYSVIMKIDNRLIEAALDLGCTPLQSFFKVELPAILPGVLSGLIMAFTLSLDDFVISYFTSGSDFQTLPILIYSMTKKEVKPDIYALSTLIIITILVLLLLSNFIGSRSEAHGKSKKAKKEAGN